MIKDTRCYRAGTAFFRGTKKSRMQSNLGSKYPLLLTDSVEFISSFPQSLDPFEVSLTQSPLWENEIKVISQPLWKT